MSYLFHFFYFIFYFFFNVNFLIFLILYKKKRSEKCLFFLLDVVEIIGKSYYDSLNNVHLFDNTLSITTISSFTFQTTLEKKKSNKLNSSKDNLNENIISERKLEHNIILHENSNQRLNAYLEVRSLLKWWLQKAQQISPQHTFSLLHKYCASFVNTPTLKNFSSSPKQSDPFYLVRKWKVEGNMKRHIGYTLAIKYGSTKKVSDSFQFVLSSKPKEKQKNLSSLSTDISEKPSLNLSNTPIPNLTPVSSTNNETLHSSVNSYSLHLSSSFSLAPSSISPFLPDDISFFLNSLQIKMKYLSQMSTLLSLLEKKVLSSLSPSNSLSPLQAHLHAVNSIEERLLSSFNHLIQQHKSISQKLLSFRSSNAQKNQPPPSTFSNAEKQQDKGEIKENLSPSPSHFENESKSKTTKENLEKEREILNRNFNDLIFQSTAFLLSQNQIRERTLQMICFAPAILLRPQSLHSGFYFFQKNLYILFDPLI